MTRTTALSTSADLETRILEGWEQRASLTPDHKGPLRDSVESVLAALDAGTLRVAEKTGGEWHVNAWVKQAILLSFRLNPMQPIVGPVGASGAHAMWYDKVPLKTEGWSEAQFKAAGFRIVPGAVVRRGAFVGRDVVLMPSFVNIGAHVGEGTMIDTWATVGSCAQVGRHCHISGGAGIGGVLEPLQASPVIIEDHCFIGARSEVAEGVIVGEGSVLSMGVYLGASTKIVDRATGDVSYGKVPPFSVVVPGALPGKNPGEPSLYCAVIVKRVDEKTRAKTSVNDLLRT
ncbi:MAG: 2,3,4,5-tetrahydropyridine-2,6-dicarboxylate N-succinyltransferase [Alphaproteobacteria bacterium]